MKAYDNQTLARSVFGAYNAVQLQESAQEFYVLVMTFAYRGLDDVCNDRAVCAAKYARARFAMGLREADYDWESAQ